MCFLLTASAARWALLIFDHPTPQDLVEYLNGRLIAAEPERGGEVPTTAVGLQSQPPSAKPDATSPVPSTPPTTPLNSTSTILPGPWDEAAVGGASTGGRGPAGESSGAHCLRHQHSGGRGATAP